MLGGNILAVYPHRRRRREVRFMPPLGLEYVMAAVQDLVGKIALVDMRLEEVDDLAGFIDDDTSAACISLNWPPANPEDGIVPEFDLINRLPADLFTVVGGRWATLNVDRIFEGCPHVDVVVQGDGEETIRELAVAEKLDDIRGICYRADGVVHRNPPRGFAPLSETVFPNRALRRYSYTVGSRGIETGVTVDAVLSSRGCPFRCKFCAYNADWLGRRRRWEPRSPESVLAELRTIDAEVVFFADNNFCVDMDRVDHICKLVLAEGMKKTFAVEARIDIARRPDVVRRMARAGFRIVLFGLESTSDESLQLLDKGFTIAEVRAAFDLFRRYPFVRVGFFIIGNIGENERDMRRIARFAREIGVDFVSLSYLRAELGSSLQDVVHSTPGYHIAEGPRCRVYSDRYPMRKLREIKHAVGRDFFLTPGILHGIRSLFFTGLVRPRHLWNVVKSAAVVLLRRLFGRNAHRV